MTRLALSGPTARAGIAAAALAAFAASTAVAAPLIGTASAAGQAGSHHFVVTAAEAAGPAHPGVGTPAEDRARGLVWRDLVKQNGGPCDDGYQMRGDHGTLCTHGPDEAPPGVDVRHRPTVDQLAAETSAILAAASPSAETAVPCYGDGVSGKRVEAIYAHAADVSDRYSSVAPLIRTWAAATDQVFVDSAAETGQIRHVRWVTDSGCQLVVDDVQLSTTGDDSMSNTMTELRNLGFNSSNRHYLVWVDATVYCGIGHINGDDQPGVANANNGGPDFARVDSGCWGQANPLEAHELMHTFGGVQLSAPHSSNGWHCTDEYDRMCYNDGYLTSGQTITYPCPTSHERLYDCNHDDYFYAGTPPATNYLATHWNAANSVYLESVDPGSPTPSPTSSSPTPIPTTSSPAPSPSATSTSPAPAPTSSTSSPAPTTSSPAPTTTTYTFTGSLNKSWTSRSFAFTAGAAGTAVVDVSFTHANSLTVTLQGPNGSAVGAVTGRSTIHAVWTIPGGATYTLVVSGKPASFTATVAAPSGQ